MKKNALNWFEIYVSDIAKATKFYETILATKLAPSEMEGCDMSMFPCDMEAGVGGAIVKMEPYEPGPGGTMVYLNVEGDLDTVISRIPAAGGKMIKERMAIPPHGFIAIFEDCEGNIVGLHSMS